MISFYNILTFIGSRKLPGNVLKRFFFKFLIFSKISFEPMAGKFILNITKNYRVLQKNFTKERFLRFFNESITYSNFCLSEQIILRDSFLSNVN